MMFLGNNDHYSAIFLWYELHFVKNTDLDTFIGVFMELPLQQFYMLYIEMNIRKIGT